MAAQKQVKSSGKFNFQSSSVTGRKKKMLVLLLALAVVGAVIVIRSFAATTVISFNPGDNLTNGLIAGFTNANAKLVSETVTDGKKTNTVNFAELNRGAQQNYGVYLSYKAKLNTGYYQGCFTAKPTTAGASTVITSFYPDNGPIGMGMLMIKENPPANWTTTPATLNQQKEYCTNFAVSTENNGKEFEVRFNVQTDSTNQATNTWRVSNFALKLNAREEITPTLLINAANGALKDLATSTSGTINATAGSFYDEPSGRTSTIDMSIYRDGQHSVTTDTVAGLTQQVFQSTHASVGQRTQFINSANNSSGGTSLPDPVKTSNKIYQGCYKVKSTTPGATAQLTSTAITQTTGTYETTLTKAVAAAADYQTVCISHLGIKGGQYLDFEFQTLTGTWRVQDAWIQEAVATY